MKSLYQTINEKKTINIKSGVFKTSSPTLYVISMDDDSYLFIEDERDFENHFNDVFDDARGEFDNVTKMMSAKVPSCIAKLSNGWKITQIK